PPARRTTTATAASSSTCCARWWREPPVALRACPTAQAHPGGALTSRGGRPAVVPGQSGGRPWRARHVLARSAVVAGEPARECRPRAPPPCRERLGHGEREHDPAHGRRRRGVPRGGVAPRPAPRRAPSRRAPVAHHGGAAADVGLVDRRVRHVPLPL